MRSQWTRVCLCDITAWKIKQDPRVDGRLVAPFGSASLPERLKLQMFSWLQQNPLLFLCFPVTLSTSGGSE